MSFKLPNRRSLGPFTCGALLVGASFLAAPTHAFAASNLRPERSQAWAPNFGWVNWRPDPILGVEVGQFILAGWAWSANAGWVSLGSGNPVDGVHYRNDSASDFGVNVDAAGRLRGFAYGANIGWINFESAGAPRLDLETGQLSGYAYGANVGWINLGEADVFLAVESISAGADRDGDGIPDAWELFYAGDLTRLSAHGDADQDGQSDLQEYWADTDPLDPNDRLRVVSFSMLPGQASARLVWTSKATRQYQVQTKSQPDPTQPWLDTGLGLQRPDGEATTRNVPASQNQAFFQIRAVRPLSP